MAFTEHCPPVIIEVDEMVVEQIRRLGLGHLINVPSMEFPHGIAPGLPRRPKRLETPVDIDVKDSSSWKDERTLQESATMGTTWHGETST